MRPKNDAGNTNGELFVTSDDNSALSETWVEDLYSILMTNDNWASPIYKKKRLPH